MIGKRDVHPNINIGSDNVDKASTYDVQDHDVQDHLKVLFQKNHLPSNLFEPSIPYRKPKEHPYMSELSLFSAYVRTGHVRTYAAITPNAPYRVDDQVRTKRT